MHYVTKLHITAIDNYCETLLKTKSYLYLVSALLILQLLQQRCHNLLHQRSGVNIFPTKKSYSTPPLFFKL